MKMFALRFTTVVGFIIGLSVWLATSANVDVLTQGSIDAKALFEKDCAKCHGKDGRAKSIHGRIVGARNLTDEEWQAKITDDQIKEAIKTGPGKMPSFEKKLSEDQINALAAYVRQFKGTAPKK